ncbi:MAG TPA: hemerythrin, partial [Anaeromyxobacteraceae bacterium]|nr:hemerythrin [Anaeromyxobacteraceae bacterium]
EVHFGSEELLMEAIGFREGATHSGEHEALRGRMREIVSLLQDEQTDSALTAALELREQIAGHVATADRRLAEETAGR